MLINTKVTDVGVRELKELKGLRTLYLDETQITDGCLEDLKEMKGLKALYLSRTRISEQGLQALSWALPETKGIYGQ